MQMSPQQRRVRAKRSEEHRDAWNAQMRATGHFAREPSSEFRKQRAEVIMARHDAELEKTLVR